MYKLFLIAVLILSTSPLFAEKESTLNLSLRHGYINDRIQIDHQLTSSVKQHVLGTTIGGSHFDGNFGGYFDVSFLFPVYGNIEYSSGNISVDEELSYISFIPHFSMRWGIHYRIPLNEYFLTLMRLGFLHYQYGYTTPDNWNRLNIAFGLQTGIESKLSNVFWGIDVGWLFINYREQFWATYTEFYKDEEFVSNYNMFLLQPYFGFTITTFD